MGKGKVLTAALAAALSARVHAATYAITDLGTGTATGINNANQVVGTLPGNVAYVYANGVTTPLFVPIGATASTASGINSQGQIAGSFTIGGVSHAGIYSGSGWTDLYGMTYNGNHPTNAVGISDTGSVVGNSFLYANGTVTQLPNNSAGPPPYYVAAVGGTDGATAVGYTGTPPGRSQSFNYQAVVVTGGVATILDPGVFAGNANQATGINANGDVIGYTFGTAGAGGTPYKYDSLGFIYSHGTYTRLYDPNGYPNGGITRGINLSDQVVGTNGAGYVSDTGVYYDSRPYAALWYDGVVTDLNTTIPAGTGWNLIDANAINDTGAIIGDGTLNGVTHSFLLTPTPEPAGVALLALGGISLAARRRRARC